MWHQISSVSKSTPCDKYNHARAETKQGMKWDPKGCMESPCGSWSRHSHLQTAKEASISSGEALAILQPCDEFALQEMESGKPMFRYACMGSFASHILILLPVRYPNSANIKCAHTCSALWIKQHDAFWWQLVFAAAQFSCRWEPSEC